MLTPSSTRLAQGTFVSTPDLKESPRASVILVNYNGGKLLTRCLRSLQQECKQLDEIILIDNASIDGSVEEVEEAFPDVQVIHSEVNLGFGAGNNLGFQFSKGKYLAFLNPDAIVEPGWLEALIAALEADPQAGLATSKILLLNDPERINTCGNEIHCTGLTMCRGMGMDRNALPEMKEVNAISGAAFVIRRELFESLGGFDGTFFMYMEDTDLSWRAKLAGYRSIYVPTSIAHHDYSLRFGPNKTFYEECNRYQMLLKVLKWRTLMVMLPILLLAEWVTWGFVLLRQPNRLTNKLRAYAWIIHNWGSIMGRRRQVQALRHVRDRDLVAASTYRLAFEQTGNGLAARMAHFLFDPLFFILRQWALVFIWW